MRILTLLIGFSAGAYLMLRLTTAMPVQPPVCPPDSVCAVQDSRAPPPRQGLRVVVYDPALEPWSPSEPTEESAHLEARLAENHLPVDGSRSAERTGLITPPKLAIVPLAEPDAQGLCAALNGRRLHCVALLNPAFD